MFPILQIALQTDTVAQVTQTVAESASTGSAFSLFDILVKGGIIMIPITLLFTAAIFIFIERFITISRASKREKLFIDNVFVFMKSKEKNEALQLCESTNLPLARMYLKGIKRINDTPKEVENALEMEGKFEIGELEKGLPVLAVIAGIAPMFGFLGTIIGVIKIFFDISQTTDVSIGAVSAGLYVKMVSSAAGLVVGILAYIFYNWLNIKLNKVSTRLERNAMLFVDFLKDNAH